MSTKPDQAHSLNGISEDDRAFLHRMFNRRHLFSHRGGKVDQEYLDRTRDSTVRLNEVVTVKSKEVRRLLGSPSRGELPRRLRFDFISEAGSSVAHEFS